MKMYSSNQILSTKDCGEVFVCGGGKTYLVPIGTKTTELFDTLIKMFNGQLDRPYYAKNALPSKPIFGILRLNDPVFVNMKESHRDFFTMLLDHYTGLQIIFENSETNIEYPIHIYGHNDEHVWRIHCNDIVTEVPVDASTIVNETINSFQWAYQRNE